MRWNLSLALLLALTACDPAPMEPDGSVDADISDAGPVDAGPPDSGSTDAGPRLDAGRDSGDVDSGSVDAGPVLDAGPTDAGPSGSCDLSDFANQHAEGICALYSRCGTYTGEARSGACHPAYRDLLGAPLSDPELELDPVRACACLEAVAAPTCEFWGVVNACSGLYRHRTTPTQCGDNRDCDPYDLCDRSGEVCPGTCRPAPGVGEPCESFLCAEGLRCSEGTCATRAAVGEVCEDTSDCAIELSCVSGVCAGPAAAGEPCEDNAYCQAGLVCSDGTCVAGVSTGGSCAGSQRCALDHRCADDVCVRALQPGQACTSEDECPLGFACDGVCVAQPRVGDACPGGECFLGSCVSGQCELSPDGAACESSLSVFDQCQSGGCHGGICAARAALGADCNFSTPCADGLECRDEVCEQACAL